MKQYTKPAMMVLSLSANDMLCSGCVVKLMNDDFGQILLGSGFDTTGDGRITWEDFSPNLFGAGEDQCSATDPFLEAYCKFTSNNGATAIWS